MVPLLNNYRRNKSPLHSHSTLFLELLFFFNKFLNINDDQSFGSVWAWLKFQRDLSLIKYIDINARELCTVGKRTRIRHKICDGNTVEPNFVADGLLAVWLSQQITLAPREITLALFPSTDAVLLVPICRAPHPLGKSVARARNHHLHIIEVHGEDCIHHSWMEGSVSVINWIWSRSSGIACAEELFMLCGVLDSKSCFMISFEANDWRWLGLHSNVMWPHFSGKWGASLLGGCSSDALAGGRRWPTWDDSRGGGASPD